MVRPVRKTYQEQQEQLRPTPAQQREREVVVLWRGRTRSNTALQHCPPTLPSNTALQQRITLWKQRGVSLARYQQEAELKALRPDYAALRRTTPDYAALHSQVLQDVLARLDTPYQAVFRPFSARLPPVFRRMANGVASSQGSPACRGGTAITPAPTRSMATVPAGIMATSS
ncbi:MAG TPA: hypothetical protein VGS80_21320, partial [Ktedonobacterales bacterium]|nr:hypothetical protein [Ktedonobacterales bacterium]